MPERTRERPGLVVEVPGASTLYLAHLVLDFNGTLAREGRLLPGVMPRLDRLGKQLEVSILTADTFGTARAALRGSRIDVHTVDTGADKSSFVRHRKGVVAIGNGRNDEQMLRAAALGIAVIGPEGCAAQLLRVADVVTRDIRDALDLLLDSKRLSATLRP